MTYSPFEYGSSDGQSEVNFLPVHERCGQQGTGVAMGAFIDAQMKVARLEVQLLDRGFIKVASAAVATLSFLFLPPCRLLRKKKRLTASAYFLSSALLPF